MSNSSFSQLRPSSAMQMAVLIRGFFTTQLAPKSHPSPTCSLACTLNKLSKMINPKEIRANRNRMSAIKSREKKFEKRDALLSELQQLQQRNASLRLENEQNKHCLHLHDPNYLYSWHASYDNSVHHLSSEPAAFYI